MYQSHVPIYRTRDRGLDVAARYAARLKAGRELRSARHMIPVSIGETHMGVSYLWYAPTRQQEVGSQGEQGESCEVAALILSQGDTDVPEDPDRVVYVAQSRACSSIVRLQHSLRRLNYGLSSDGPG